MRQAVTLLIVGLAVATLTWAGLRIIEGRASQETTRRVRICKSPDPVAGSSEGGRGWWEEQRFAQYAAKKGWDDVELDVNIVVGDYLQKYVASAVAGEAPDLISVPPNEVARWHEHGLIEPLDDFLANWDAYKEGHVNEELVDMCRGVSGEVICLTSTRHAPYIFGIRRDWLDNLRLDAPTTWDEAYEVWRAFTYDDPDGNGKDDTYGFSMSMQITHPSGAETHRDNLEIFLFAAGVRWYTTDEDGRIQPAFNVPAAAETLDFVKRAYKEGLFGKDVMSPPDPGIHPMIRFFMEKRAGMTGMILPNIHENIALQFGLYDKVTLIPFLWKDEECRRKGIYGTATFISQPWVLLGTCRDKEAAYRFLEYWFSKPSLDQAYSKRGNARERYLGRFGMYSSDAPWLTLRDDVDYFVKVPQWIEELARPVDKYVVPQPYISTWSKISEALATVFIDYYLDRHYVTAQEALDEAERRFIEIVRAQEKETGVTRPKGSRR